MANEKILIIEDEESAARSIGRFLEKNGFAVRLAASGEQGLDMFASENYAAVLLDYRLPGINGEECFRRLRELNPLTPVIFMTAYGEIERAVRLLKMGAFYYLSKPIELETLYHLLLEAVKAWRLDSENRTLRERLQEKYSLENFIYRSPLMSEAVNLAMRVADSNATVLLTGESGTGKEVLANVIHQASPRRGAPMVKVNLAALPVTLIEAELFGAEKGAFTGADRQRIGRFEEVAGGTVFLDEIGDLPLEIQMKLLRVLQEKEINRLGSNRAISIDARLISATNRDLSQAIVAGTFREDLFYRINTVTISIPPLRRRKQDIPFLVAHFIRRVAERENRPVRGISAVALDQLVKYDFPGNVRELENIIERAVVLARSELIGIDDLPASLLGPRRYAADLDALPMPQKLKEIERQLIREALARNAGVQTRTARDLGISESTLRYRMDALGLKHR